MSRAASQPGMTVASAKTSATRSMFRPSTVTRTAMARPLAIASSDSISALTSTLASSISFFARRVTFPMISLMSVPTDSALVSALSGVM